MSENIFESLNKLHREEVERVAEKLTKETVNSLVSELKGILSRPILIQDYEHVAQDLASTLIEYEDIYDCRDFSGYIKRIDPRDSGKPQTFLDYVEKLSVMMHDVADCMNKIQAAENSYDHP